MTDDTIVACPECAFTGPLDKYEVGGADPGKVFCPMCLLEFKPKELKQKSLFGKP